MRKIYPKISPQEICNEMENIVAQSEGIELQFFNENGIAEEFDFETEVRKRKNQFPNLKEIVIHPPLDNYGIELIMFKNEEIFKNQLEKLAQLSEELNITTSFVYHTYWTKDQAVTSHLIDKMRKLLKIVEGKNVYILIENLYMILEEKRHCAALEITKEIDHPNVRTCIDTTHVHCRSNMMKYNFKEMLKQYFNKEDCEKYVRQIHFAAALNNDGYIDKKTHGRKHPSLKETEEELLWLREYGMGDKNYITEISEEDYFSRKDQIEEIKMLKEISQDM